MYGGERSADPRLTSYVLIGINAVVWLAIAATGGGCSRLADLLALRADGACAPGRRLPLPRHRAAASARRPAATFLPGVADGAWWQLLTSVFTHVEIWHLAMNMFALFIFGPGARGHHRPRPLPRGLPRSAAWPRRCSCSTFRRRLELHRRRLRRPLRPARRPAGPGPQGAAQLAVADAEPRARCRHHRRRLALHLLAGPPRRLPRRGGRGDHRLRPESSRALVQWVGLGLLLAVLLGLALVRDGALA